MPEVKLPPLVSFIVPCFEQWHWLPECLASIQAQTVQVFEIILTTETPGQLEAAGSVDWNGSLIDKLVWHKQQVGLAASRTAALAIAKGECIVPLDADDTIEPTFLENTLPIAWASKDPIAAVVVNGGGRLNRAITKDNYLNYCALYRTDTLRALNGWQQPSKLAQGLEDWDLWIRMYHAGYEIESVDQKLFNWRRTPGSMSSKFEGTELFNRMKQDMLKRNGLPCE